MLTAATKTHALVTGHLTGNGGSTVELALTTWPRSERRKIDRETRLPLLDP